MRFLFSFFLITQIIVSVAAAESLKIFGVPPDQRFDVVQGGRWDIFLEGPIDREAATRLKEFLREKNIVKRSVVHLHSDGGNLFSGMELGEIFRENEFSVYVAKYKGVEDGISRSQPGECHSACTLAFVGGKFRFLDEKTVFGVHQFSFMNPADSNAGAAQIASASIVAYLRRMGVDSDFFTLTTFATPDRIYLPNSSVLKKLNVVNGGIDSPRWTVESTGDSLYLKGERDTVFGYQKLLVYCPKKPAVFMHLILEAQRRDSQLMSFPVHTLELGPASFRVHPVDKQMVNGNFNAIYPLSREQVSRLKGAQSVSLRLQFSADAPIFLGIGEMPIEGGKAAGFLATCLP